MKFDNLLTIALQTFTSEKAKAYVCMHLSDIINSQSYLIVFGGSQLGITSIKAFKKCVQSSKFQPVNFHEINAILPACTRISINVTDEANLSKTFYNIFYDVSNDDYNI